MEGEITTPPFPEKKGSAKRKAMLVGVILLISVIFLHTFGIIDLTKLKDTIQAQPTNSPSQPSEPSQPSGSGGGGTAIKLGKEVILYEELDLTEPWVKELSIDEGTYLRLDSSFDNPVRIRFIIPLQTGNKYMTEFSQKGWVSQGMGSEHVLELMPETHANGTIMLTKLGHI